MKELAKYDELVYLKVLSRTIIHDFNNVMGAIYGALSIIKFEMGEEKEKNEGNIGGINDLEEEIHEIDLASKKSFRLIKILHNNIKQTPFIKKQENIERIVKELIKEILSNLKDDIEIKFNCYTTTTQLKCSVSLIKILFYNLIKNAIEAINAKKMLKTKQINIEMSENKNKLIFKIDDSGVKFDLEHSINYFSPLYTTKEKEYGLGLPICSTITRIHGGMIKLNDENEKCKVYIEFPNKD